MSVSTNVGSFIATPGQTLSLGTLFSTTADANNPKYVVVNGLDRDEYTAAARGSFGTFSGNGASTGFSILGDDSYGAGIVFTYNSTTGQYTNATFGNLTNVTMTASTDLTRNESISIFGTNNLGAVASIANDPYSLSDSATYLGSVNVVTATPGTLQATQATPNSIVSAASSFIGQSWNTSGCWVLCSNIAAKAGASLPVTSTLVDVPGVANGEWIVAYNGPAGQGGDWQSMVKAGEMIVFATSATSGHITTCVAGSGASAELVDNITYVTPTGAIANSADDGSPNDVTVAAPHLASQEFAQVVAGSVVIYELDTPTVTAVSGAPSSVGFGSRTALSQMVTASDPGNRAITEYQVYDVGTLGSAGDAFILNGATVSAHTAATAITTSAADLASTFLQAANTVAIDTVMVRAYNGAYWGDWTSDNILVAGSGSTTSAPASAAPATTPASTPTPVTTPTQTASAPTLSSQTADQVWMKHQRVTLSLSSSTFTSTSGVALTYTEKQLSGRKLGLTFNAATETLSGTLLNRATTAKIEIIATDASGKSATEEFTVTVAANARQFTQAVSALKTSTGASSLSLGTASTAATSLLASPVKHA